MTRIVEQSGAGPSPSGGGGGGGGFVDANELAAELLGMNDSPPGNPGPAGAGGAQGPQGSGIGGDIDIAQLASEVAQLYDVIPGPPGPPLGPNFAGGPVQITTAGTFTLATIPLDDDADYSISFQITVRSTSTDIAKWKDTQDWDRASGGNPVLVGTSDGPAPVVPVAFTTLVGNWAQLVQSGTNVLLQLVTANTQHIMVSWDGDVRARSLPVAT